MTRKVYESIGYQKLSLTLDVEGVKKYIDFTGGGNYPSPANGKYATENKAIQDSLEKNENYNTLYKLVYVNNISLIPEVKKVSLEDQIEELRRENQRLVGELNRVEIPIALEEGVTYVKDVFNAQQAKDYLLKEFPEEFTTKNLPNKVTIQKRAKEKNIVFTDWQE